MGQVDVHLAGGQQQIHGGHTPGVFDAQNTPVKLAIFHDDWMDLHAVGVHGAVIAARRWRQFRGG
jgi:hypothetical protein